MADAEIEVAEQKELPAIATTEAFLSTIQETLGAESVRISGSVKLYGEAIVCRKLTYVTPAGRMQVVADLNNRPVYLRKGSVVNPYDLSPSSMSVRSQLAAGNLSPAGQVLRPAFKTLGQLEVTGATGWFLTMILGSGLLLPFALLALGHSESLFETFSILILALASSVSTVCVLAERSRRKELRAALISDIHRAGASFVGSFTTDSHGASPSVAKDLVATAKVSHDGKVKKVWMMKDHYRFTSV